MRIFRCVNDDNTTAGWRKNFRKGSVYELNRETGSFLQLRGDAINGRQALIWVDTKRFEEIHIEDLVKI